MVSFRTTFLALAGAIAVSADYWVDPDTVLLQDRMAWCNDQRSVCPIICLQTTADKPRDNSCDADKLTYGCVCSDGKQPNITEYTLTLPYHVCTRWGTDCVADCKSDNDCSYRCRAEHPCGAQNPTPVNATSSTTVEATQTSTPTNQVYDGFGTDSQGSTERQNTAGALRFGDSFGLAVVAGGLFAGFAMLL